MLMFLSDHIDWIKALHVIAVIAWMAGMLYLPRLFVYHCEAPAGSPQSEMLKVMERRLLRVIINPAMIAIWIFGLTLACAHRRLCTSTGSRLKFVLVHRDERAARLVRCNREAFRPRREYAAAALLPDHERSADAADHRHRHPGRS